MKNDTAAIEREKTMEEIIRLLADADEEALRFICVRRTGEHARRMGI